MQSHEKKFIASKNKDRIMPIAGHHALYGGGVALHEQMSMSSFSSIYQGTVPGMREHDSLLNDSMATPSRKSSRDERDGYIDAQASPLPHMMDKKRSSLSRSELSFCNSDTYQMSRLTSQLADKEKRIEEYRDHIARFNASHDILKQ